MLGCGFIIAFLCAVGAFDDGVVGEHNPAVVAIGVSAWFLGFWLFNRFLLLRLVGFVEVSFLVEPCDWVGGVLRVFVFASKRIDVGCADDYLGVYC